MVVPNIPSVKGVLANTLAYETYSLYRYADNHIAQMLPDSEIESVVDKWASLYGLQRKEATRSHVKVKVSSSEKVTLLPKDEWIHDGKTSFVPIAAYEIHGDTECIFESKEPGAIGNLKPNEQLTISNPIPNIDSEATVKKLILEGLDAESYDSIRSRIKEKIKRPAHGGCLHDYVLWSLECPGITKSWVMPRQDDKEKKHVNIIARKDDGILSPEERNNLQEFLETKRPLGAKIKIVPETIKKVDIKVELTPPIEVPQKEIIEALREKLTELFDIKAAPRGYRDISNTKQTGIVYVSDLVESIMACQSVTKFRLLEPSEHVAPDKDGEVLALGEVYLAV